MAKEHLEFIKEHLSEAEKHLRHAKWGAEQAGDKGGASRIKEDQQRVEETHKHFKDK